jgi:hypothetical protein
MIAIEDIPDVIPARVYVTKRALTPFILAG